MPSSLFAYIEPSSGYIKQEMHLQALSIARASTASGKGCGNEVTKSLIERRVHSSATFFISHLASPRRRRGGMSERSDEIPERDSRTELCERSDEIPRRGNHFNPLYSSQLTLFLLFFQDRNYDVRCKIHILTDCSHI